MIFKNGTNRLNLYVGDLSAWNGQKMMGEKMEFEERRKYPRIRLIAKVSLGEWGQSHYFYSIDLSVGGIFLETDHAYPEGSRLELEFALPEIADKLKLVGEVVRVDPPEARQSGTIPGMGIRFIKIDLDTQAMLADFIARELARK